MPAFAPPAPAMPPPPVVLASQSPYRRELLGRLLPDFVAAAQHVDESPRPGEGPEALALRLAVLKAQSGAARHPGAIVIGSDQVASRSGVLLGKPGTAEQAEADLLACSGSTVEFHTAVCVIAPGHAVQTHVDTTRVRFRDLDPELVRRYVAADQPLDCAGSFRVERRGVILFRAVESEDPTALQGLPLIWTAAALRQCGIDLP
jgi:septum formation protein